MLSGKDENSCYAARNKEIILPPPLNISGGGARKMCIILNYDKTTLPIQDIL